MKPFSALALFVLTTAAAAVMVAAKPANIPGVGEELVNRFCKESEDKEFCHTSLMSHSGAKDANAAEMGVIALTMASGNASDTSFYIKRKLKGALGHNNNNFNNLDPALEDTLDDCSQNYLDAVAQLDDSLAALLANSFADVDIWLNVAITDGESCETALSERDGSDPELARRNENFLKLCKNALLINNILTPN